MKNTRSKLFSWLRACLGFLVLELILLVSTERPARAYVDPGSGALFWQGLIATMLGLAFYFRRLIGWVRSKLSKGNQH